VPENKSLNILINTKYEGKGLTDLRKDFNDNKKTLDELRRTNQQTSDTYKNLVREQGHLSDSIRGLTREYKGLSAQQKMSKFQLLEFGENLTIVGAGIGMLVGKVGSFVSASMQLGSSLTVLQSNFKGTAQDLELFRQATAGTVTDANLIKLSNQATDLGISLDKQALLFSLAEDAGDKYGGSVEENINRVVLAIAKNGRGLESLGITTINYKKVFEELLTQRGLSADSIDEETRLQVGYDAIMKLTGMTLQDVTNKTKDVADKMESLKVQQEEVTTAFGQGINIVFNETFDLASKLVTAFNDMTKSTLSVKDAAKILGESITSALISPLLGLKKLIDEINSNPLLSMALNGIGRGGGSANDVIGGQPLLTQNPAVGAIGRGNGMAGEAINQELSKNFITVNNAIIDATHSLSAFFGVLAGGDSSNDGFKDFMKSIVNTFITSIEAMILASAAAMSGKAITTFGLSLFTDAPLLAAAFASLELARGIIGGLAGGGQAVEGRPYIVGEQGREMFVPNTTGQVINTMDLKNMMSGSSSSPTNIYINSEVDFIRFHKVMNAQVRTRRQDKIL